MADQNTAHIADIRYTLDFTPEAKAWFSSHPDYWFSHDEGTAYIVEHHLEWVDIFEHIAKEETFDLFSTSLPENSYPVVEVLETNVGSLTIFATMYLFAASVRTGLKVGNEVLEFLEHISRLPDTVDGLKKVWETITRKTEKEIEVRIRKVLTTDVGPAIHTLPKRLIMGDLELILDPAINTSKYLISHTINLTLEITEERLIIKNEAKDSLINATIGLLFSPTEQNSLNIVDTFRNYPPEIEGYSEYSIPFTEFENEAGLRLGILKRERRTYIYCWIIETYGTYLFKFVWGATKSEPRPVRKF